MINDWFMIAVTNPLRTYFAMSHPTVSRGIISKHALRTALTVKPFFALHGKNHVG